VRVANPREERERGRQTIRPHRRSGRSNRVVNRGAEAVKLHENRLCAASAVVVRPQPVQR
jgi:hypothetical protein